jgi:hypothetical protein
MNDDAQARIVFLVGNRFAGFAVDDQVITVDSFVHAVDIGRFDDLPDPLVVRVGQGVDHADLAFVQAAVARNALCNRLVIQVDGHAPLAPRQHVHKHRPQNVLISGIHQVCDHKFQAELRIHNDNELLLDHQTGLHVQGMVVVEAARQMFLTVTECFYASRWPDRRYGYMLNSMSTRFENMLFPVEATIHYTVEDADLSRPGRLGFRVLTEVWQSSRRASTTEMECVALESGRLESFEARSAGQALSGILKDC